MTGIARAVTSGAVYAAADQLLAQRGHSFHWARRLLSKRHAERATRLYGFCRRIDDIADEAIDAAAACAALSVVRQALQTGECHDNDTTETVDMLLDMADRYYASGEQGLHYLPAGARTGILVASRVYRGIGTVLREREFDCWSARSTVGTAGKVAITLRALVATATPAALRPSDVARMPDALSQGLSPRRRIAAWNAEASVAD